VAKNSVLNTKLLAEAIAACAIELSGSILNVGEFERNIQKIIKAANPRFKDEFKAASVHALKIDSTRIEEIKSNLDLSSLLEILTVNTLGNLTESQVKSKGATHTPLQVSRYITRNAIKWWQKQNPKLKSPKTVGDLSVGVGSFLLALHLEGIGRDSKIIGMDSNLHSVLCCELLRISVGANWEIFHSDSLLSVNTVRDLFSSDPEFENFKFDLLIGNPPYVRSSNLPAPYISELRGKFEYLVKGNFDLSVAFLEQARKSLNTNGVFSYITSSKFSDSKYGEAICNSISKESRVLAIENFGDVQVFPGFTTYVLILTVAKSNPAKRFHYTSFDTKDLSETLESTKAITLQTDTSLTFPWTFTTDEFLEIRRKLTSTDLPLVTDYFSGIFQGVRTGSNEVFVVSETDSQQLEKELLIPFVSGREIKRQYLTEISNSLLFPYKVDEFRTPSLIEEDKLAKDYKKVYKRLLAHKRQLLERSLENNAEWYGYSRSQSLSTFLKPKLFVKEMMPRAEFAYDSQGVMAFGSGYALDATVLQNGDLAMWTAILNTPVLEFSLRNIGTQLHSGWFRVLKHQLIKLRLPRLTSQQKLDLNKLVVKFEKNPTSESGAAALTEINKMVAQSFGLSEEEARKIDDFLAPFHSKSIVTNNVDSGETESNSANYEPVKLEKYNSLHREKFEYQHLVTFRNAKNRPIHSWYPYTQGFDEDLVSELLREFNLGKNSVVLDPFGGVGTTGIACRKMGVKSVLNDISPLVTWIAKVKNSEIDVSRILEMLDSGTLKKGELYQERIELNPDLFANFFENAYSSEVLDKVLRYLAFFRDLEEAQETKDFLRLMLLGRLESMSNIRKHGSHYRYMNSETSVGLEKLNIPIFDAEDSVYEVLEIAVRKGLKDYEETTFISPSSATRSMLGDSKHLKIKPDSIDAVITSPPYLNRNNYIAQQKGELALLGFIQDAISYKELVKSTLISHVEGTLPKNPKSQFPEVNKIIKNVSLTEGNNPKIPFMITGYFDDMNDILLEMWRVCKSGAKLALVVGNARWGGVVIPVDHLLMQQAENIGFHPEKILVTRYKGNSPQQMRRFGRIPVRESIIVFSKP
jgi:site-specific DNA-methyltransferase (cytosine-N4-specific)